jgi:hypothetical protein
MPGKKYRILLIWAETGVQNVHGFNLCGADWVSYGQK